MNVMVERKLKSLNGKDIWEQVYVPVRITFLDENWQRTGQLLINEEKNE